LRSKLGLFTERDGDQLLAQALLDTMAAAGADFTLTFRRLSEAAGNGDISDVCALFEEPTAFDEWAVRWRARLAEEPQSAEQRQVAMRAINPAFIPRNHRIEAVIQAAVWNDDYAPFEDLLTVLAAPYQDQPDFASYADPPKPEERVCQTFCGT
jgi:serine/tyrosine/threonine adenylyltransferase